MHVDSGVSKWLHTLISMSVVGVEKKRELCWGSGTRGRAKPAG